MKKTITSAMIITSLLSGVILMPIVNASKIHSKSTKTVYIIKKTK